MNEKIIKLYTDEIWPLANILNEICNGLIINNFEDSIGRKELDVVILMNKILNKEDKESAIFHLNNTELNILSNSFKEVFKQIEEWEFQTRIGITIKEAINIQKKFE